MLRNHPVRFCARHAGLEPRRFNWFANQSTGCCSAAEGVGADERPVVVDKKTDGRDLNRVFVNVDSCVTRDPLKYKMKTGFDGCESLLYQSALGVTREASQMTCELFHKVGNWEPRHARLATSHGF
jgi:hypothetical protein